MRIWIVSQFTENIDENTSNRYAYIYNLFLKRGYEVKFIMSDFSHVTKRKKDVYNSNVIRISEPGYRSNVSIKRMYSHIVYAMNAYKYLRKNIEMNDIVIVALPSNLLGYLLSKLKRKIKFNLVIDIHDIWPNSLIALLPKILQIIGTPIWYLWESMRYKSAKECDFLIAESNEYEGMHRHLLKDSVQSETILLGADIDYIKNIPVLKINQSKAFKVVFAGTLGVNYDIDTTIKMVRKYHNELLNNNIEIYFFGNGEKEKDIYALSNDFPSVVFHINRRAYNEYIGILKSFDLGINSFQKGSSVRYSYKSVDYLVSGLPLLNNLQGEFFDDVVTYNLGLNYSAGEEDSLYLALRTFVDEQKNREPQFHKKNVEEYVKVKLDRNIIYRPLLEFVENK